MIKVENLSHKYRSGTLALQDVNVEFPSGTVSAILGESGSGKTTMLMCLGRFLSPTFGCIRLNGRNILDIPEPEFRKAVGIVFQKLYLFPHLSVLQNMTLAMKCVQGVRDSQATKEACEMLERLGIPEVRDSYPSQISGGQAQRVAIARGLLLQPEYMLLDEPTSALDANTTDEFAKWLWDLRQETNFIIVTHDTLFAEKVACTGIYLSQGQVMDSGSIENIVRHVRAGQLVDAK